MKMTTEAIATVTLNGEQVAARHDRALPLQIDLFTCPIPFHGFLTYLRKDLPATGYLTRDFTPKKSPIAFRSLPKQTPRPPSFTYPPS